MRRTVILVRSYVPTLSRLPLAGGGETDEDGRLRVAPIRPGVSVVFATHEGRSWASARTEVPEDADEQGRFRLTGVPHGTVRRFSCSSVTFPLEKVIRTNAFALAAAGATDVEVRYVE